MSTVQGAGRIIVPCGRSCPDQNLNLNLISYRATRFQIAWPTHRRCGQRFVRICYTTDLILTSALTNRRSIHSQTPTILLIKRL